MKMINLCQLVGRHLPPITGSDSGVCYITGIETEIGHRTVPSEGFTAWPQCYPGSVISPEAMAMLKERHIRGRSWLCTESALVFTNDEESKRIFYDALVAPPEPPFAIYYTKGMKKQGWVGGVLSVNYNRKLFWVLSDIYENPVQFNAADGARIHAEACALRVHKISKAELVSGNFSPHAWARSMREGWGQALADWQRWVGNPQMVIMVQAMPNDAE